MQQIKRLLLTGASGFIGRQVISPLLRQGYEVHVTSRSSLGIPELHEHQMDLFDEAAVSRLVECVQPTLLIHLAWFTRPPEYWQSPLNVVWERHSMHLFESFAQNGGERIIGTGTCAEYEWASDILTEEVTPERPATSYGRAKLSLKRKAEELARKSNISLSWARFFFLFGRHERNERFVPSIVDPLLRGDVAYCRNADLRRDYMYVEDAGEGLVALAMSHVEGSVNVASGISSRLGDIAQHIGYSMGLPELVSLSADESHSAQPESLVANVSRLTAEVGWRPRYALADALDQTIAWRAAQARINEG